MEQVGEQSVGRRLVHAREAELARRWATGAWRGCQLQTERGEALRVLYEGRPGGGAGPDFRDAVLVTAEGARLRGDIELHLRPRGWRAHGHAVDPRYDGLILHIVLARDTSGPETALASGRRVPLVVLGEPPRAPIASWPCRDVARTIPLAEMTRRLQDAGIARLRQRANALLDELRATLPERVLWRALAEALGYGRDREALREMGDLLARGSELDAEDVASLGRVERARLRGLLAWYDRWRPDGPWSTLEPPLLQGAPGVAGKALIRALRVEGGAVSPGRAAIVAVNVVLPFAIAWAELTGRPAFATRVEDVYRAMPGLPSNQITRLLTRQLGLKRQPPGAAAQQGLHHLWAEHCRDKLCASCPYGKNDICYT